MLSFFKMYKIYFAGGFLLFLFYLFYANVLLPKKIIKNQEKKIENLEKNIILERENNTINIVDELNRADGNRTQDKIYELEELIYDLEKNNSHDANTSTDWVFFKTA